MRWRKISAACWGSKPAAIVEKVPPPKGEAGAALQALVFDSHYDSYKGVIAYIRVVQGTINATDTLLMMSTRYDLKPVEIGIFAPGMKPVKTLSAGEVGYIATGFKTVHECRVGDTITNAFTPNRWFLLGSTLLSRMIIQISGSRWINYN
jgi:GTP-binding protein LepA